MESQNFSKQSIQHAQELMVASTQLEQLGTYWIGPDVSIEQPFVAEPGKLMRNVKIILNKNDLPPGVDWTRGALDALGTSVRSFFAQTGIDVRFHSSSLSDELITQLQKGEGVSVPLEVKNYGGRPVEIDGRLMRFFWVNEKKRLRGEDLLEAVKSGEFKVEGKEGEDWFLGGYNEEDKLTTNMPGSDQGLCVVVRLNPERFYIPESNEIIRRDEKIKIREQLAEYLVPVPAGKNLPFEIGETPKITIGQNLVAVINTGVGNDRRRHINSPLADSGSDWKIRTEILQPHQTPVDHFVPQPTYLDFFIYKK